ncbi:MAG: sensor histidine kinase [Myxococcota bacterium]
MPKPSAAPLWGGSSLTRRRQAIVALVASFVALLVGLAGLNIVAVYRIVQLSDGTMEIFQSTTRDLEVLNTLRNEQFRIRAWARSYVDSPRDRPELEHLISRAFNDSLAAAAAYEERHPRELVTSRDWRDIRSAMNELHQHIDRALEAARRGDGPSAGKHLADAGEMEFWTYGAFQRLMELETSETRDAAKNELLALRRTSRANTTLAVVASISAAVLLAIFLRTGRRYDSDVQERRVGAEARASELEAFASRVAHDLRNPLQALRTALELALLPGARARSDEVLARAQRSLSRLDALISTMLAFAQSGARPERGAHVSVREVLLELEAECQPRASERGIELVVQAPRELEVAMSPVLLRSLMGNLLDNAMKYLREEGPRRVEVSAKAADRQVLLTVTDTGVGIPPELMPMLFQPFYRGTTLGGGYGLGLATVKRLVDSHDGRLEVESDEKRGTAFRIFLPRWPIGLPVSP